MPVGGAQPNPVMLYVNLDRPSLRHGRIDEPPRPFLLTLSRHEVETLEVQALTSRYYAEWWLEFKLKAGNDRRTMKVDDHGEPFRTTVPAFGSNTVSWDRGLWRPAAALRHRVGEALP
jgi:hypothetical protein